MQGIYYIIGRELWQQPLPAATGCLLLLISSEEDVDAAYRFASDIGSIQPFALLLDAEVVHEKTARLFIPFLFIPQYGQVENNPAVFITNTPGAHQQQAWMAEVNAQGYRLHLQLLSQQQIISAADARQMSAAIHNLWYNQIDAVYLRVYQWQEVDAGNKVIEQEMENCKKDNPSYFQLRTGQQSLKERTALLEKQLSAAKEEIENQQSHLSILQSGTQAAELQRFYQNEYEVLPRWYKQLGHLIKVVTGKRRFKSLFNDQEKKYKS